MAGASRPRAGLGVARGDRARVGRPADLARARDARAVHLRRRADLLGARAEPRRHGLVRGAGRLDERVQHPLPGAARPRLRALRRAAGRVRGGEGDQRDRDVPRGGPGLAPHPSSRREAAVAPRRGARRRPAVDGLHGDDRHREPLLSARPAVRVDARAGARATHGRAHRRTRRGARRGGGDPLAGARLRGRGRARAVRPRPAPPRSAGRPSVRPAARRCRRDRDPRARRAAAPRQALVRPARRLQRGRRGRLRRRRRRFASGSGTSRS